MAQLVDVKYLPAGSVLSGQIGSNFYRHYGTRLTNQNVEG
jgi:hypothetical protein